MQNNYEKNMEALKTISPRMHKWIVEEPDKKWIQPIKSKNGDQNILLKTDANEKVSIYDMANPRKASRADTKKIVYDADCVTIIVGLGLGHMLKRILDKKHKTHRVIVVEPMPQFIKMAFELYDFSKWIKDTSIFFLYPDKTDICQTIGAYEALYVNQQWGFSIEKYTFLRYAEYFDLSKFIIEQVNQVRCNTGTVTGAGKEIAHNDIANIPYVIRHRGVAELTGLFEDKPAVLVSTGPSLHKNIHILKEIQENVIIIAVAQALRILNAYDIEPDFICTVDFGDVNTSHFVGLQDSKVPLVALNKTHANALKIWQGPKFIVANPTPVGVETASSVLNGKGTVEQGGSVAHLNFGFAKLLGCNPICFMGQDLSLTDSSHSPLADSGGKIEVTDGIIYWKVNDPRSSLQERNEGKLSMGPAVYAPGYFGGVVLTNTGLQSFITGFENMIRNSPEQFTIINCTEGGADIKGTEKLSLKKMSDLYCTKKIKKKKIKKYLSLDPKANELIKKALLLFEHDILNLEELVDQATLGIEIADSIDVRNDSDEVVEEKLVLNKKYSSRAEELAKLNPTVGLAIFKESREIQTKELKVKEQLKNIYKDRDILETRFKRNKIILGAAKKQAEELIVVYKESLKILSEYSKTKDESLLIDNKPYEVSFDDVETYFEAGNWAHPLLDANRVLRNPLNYEEGADLVAEEISVTARLMRTEAIEKAKEFQLKNNTDDILEYNRLVEEAKEIGREANRYEESLELLKTARELMPDKFPARWGYATSLHFLQRTEEAAEEFEKLLEENPDNHRMKFEYATILIAHDPDKGLGLMKELMEETNQFNYFRRQIGAINEKLGNIEKAVEIYKKYLEEYENDFEVWEKLGDCHAFLKQEKDAAKCYKKVKNLKT